MVTVVDSSFGRIVAAVADAAGLCYLHYALEKPL
jgi:hypothetical protein